MRIERVIGISVLASTLLGATLLFFRLEHNPVFHDSGARQYVLWRSGANPDFPKADINAYLEEDIDRDSLVRGLTLSQVKDKFADVRTREKWTPYQRWCMDRYNPGAVDDVFLGTDWWGVRFRNGHATGLFLIKGC